jgi:hypothetical protein
MKKTVIAVLVVFIAIQFIPASTQNEAFDKSKEIQTTPEVKRILQKACYDCHSFETNYSVYSKIAPLSWGVHNHIKDGRKALNFSTWQDMDAKTKEARIDRLYDEVRLGFMPLPSYLMFHKDARLSASEKEVLKAWVKML